MTLGMYRFICDAAYLLACSFAYNEYLDSSARNAKLDDLR